MFDSGSELNLAWLGRSRGRTLLSPCANFVSDVDDRLDLSHAGHKEFYAMNRLFHEST